MGLPFLYLWNSLFSSPFEYLIRLSQRYLQLQPSQQLVDRPQSRLPTLRTCRYGLRSDANRRALCVRRLGRQQR